MSAGKTAALAGNPNVGKSTIFNALTHLHQHTGNWPGKTVELATGTCRYKGEEVTLIDLPGTYSLVSKSQEEAVAADFISGGEAGCVIAVVDATNLERSLILALQVLELTDRVFVCVNLMDEAEKQQIAIDIPLLSHLLGVPVVPVSAGREEGLERLLEQLRRILDGFEQPHPRRLLPQDAAQDAAKTLTNAAGRNSYRMARLFVERAAEIAGRVVTDGSRAAKERTRKLDRFLTGPVTGYLTMGLLLFAVFWLTIVGANYPSQLLQAGFDALEGLLWRAASAMRLPQWLSGAIIAGVYRTTATVVSVMLPPVLIFFPLFTLLEDAGYLPRAAFLMDGWFERCGSCGKQALTMCMGFGCNAAGVSGCRIIDSEREKRIAMLTNALVPCNGRFPTLLTLSALYFGGTSRAAAAFILTACVLLGVSATMASSFALGKTVLRGTPSSFALELPPFRRPNLKKALVRSLLDRSLFVLGRAAAVAAPAGLALWVLANVTVRGQSLLLVLAGLLEPVGRILGMDGAILLAFFLAFPANELLLPVCAMIVSAGQALSAQTGPIGGLLTNAGWTAKTALCVMLFTLFHWPCSTTVLTIRKESGSAKWALLSIAIPTMIGIVLCILLNALW